MLEKEEALAEGLIKVSTSPYQPIKQCKLKYMGSSFKPDITVVHTFAFVTLPF